MTPEQDDAPPVAIDEVLLVPAALVDERVDRAVALLTGWSRGDVQALLDRDGILVSGRAVGKSHRLARGDVIEVLDVPHGVPLPEPEDVAVDVRYADDGVIVVSKPAGLVVHPGAGHAHGTLVHGLLARFPELATVGDPQRPGIVHRLDRDTSGLMVVARSPDAYDALTAALAAREVERRYLALVWGIPDARRAVVDAPIGRSSRRRTLMAVQDGGRAARTAYEVIEELGDVALLECTLETGRTHQIRVHLSAIGHPVVGDGAYGRERASRLAGRPFLHAAALAFVHPITGARLSFDDPLPDDLAAVLEEARRQAP